MIEFQGKQYELLFSNNLAPYLALHYADELFFKHFEEMSGARYRILCTVKDGWQLKYGRMDDLEKVHKAMESKILAAKWLENLYAEYTGGAGALRSFLSARSAKSDNDFDRKNCVRLLRESHVLASRLDAMSNLLYVWGLRLGSEFYLALKAYTNDPQVMSENFVFYTRPIESLHGENLDVAPKRLITLHGTDERRSLLLRIGAFIKEDVRRLLDLRQTHLAPLYRAVAAHVDCAPEEVMFLDLPTLEQCLDHHSSPNQLIAARKYLTVLFYEETRLSIREGSAAEAFLRAGNFHEVNESYDAHGVVGQPASLGKVRGRAVIGLTSEAAVRKMRPGDILIAPYTAVEYLPALQKAAAVVTDIGGITSHAATVSRELGIPCIIGTKFATKVFNDGDMIEVDAGEGSVERVGP